jgi:hypothetical protein
MRPSRKRKLLLWALVALLLLVIAGSIEYRYRFRDSFYRSLTADPYVPCPEGTRPVPIARQLGRPVGGDYDGR